MALRRTDASGAKRPGKKTAAKRTTKKKSKTSKGSTTSPGLAKDEAVNVAALMLINGQTHDEISVALKARKATAAVIRGAIKDAEARITLAANYKLAQELGLSIKQLRELYSKAIAAAELAVALNARKELNKLMTLYDLRPEDLADADEESGVILDQLGQIEDHLRPLGLAPDDYPVVELVRIAADQIRRAAPESDS